MKETVLKIFLLASFVETTTFFFLILLNRNFCISGCKYTVKWDACSKNKQEYLMSF